MTDTPNDNPFAEPDDGDHTVVRPPGSRSAGSRPSPGGRRDPTLGGGDETRITPPAPRRSSMRRQPPVPADLPAHSGSPLLAAAAPLLQLLARLRNTLTPPDSGDLRDRAAETMRAFEQRAQADGVPEDHLRPAHYALCASLDDAVLNTPWGSEGGWASKSLVSSFHNEVRGGEQFFTLLLRMQQNPAKFLPVLELMYLCLSLGFMGRYRLSPRGRAEIDQLREEVYAAIAAVCARAEAEMSPAWRGVSAPYRPIRMRAPLWVVGAAGLAIVGGLFAWSSISLNASSDAVYERVAQLPPTQMPAIARAAPVQAVKTVPGEPGVLEGLRQFLKPEIDAGLVAVIGTQDTPIVRIRQGGMFASGSATLAEKSAPLLSRVGTALKAEPGSVQVVGYTDDQPIRTVRFPSNFQLSAARAAAAGVVVSQALGDPSRLRTEGRASADPIAPNTTQEGRDANRRIEIVLHRPA
jgi:type VI secretion system protein ImpK